MHKARYFIHMLSHLHNNPGKYKLTHFADGETEAPSGLAHGPSSHSQWMVEPRFQLMPKSRAICFLLEQAAYSFANFTHAVLESWHKGHAADFNTLVHFILFIP